MILNHVIIQPSFFKSMIYYTGLVGRLWQIQCIYLHNRTHINRRRREEKGESERLRRCGAAPLGLCLMKTSTVVKTEGCRIVCQEVDKAVNDDVAWSCGGAMEVTLHDNMFTCLHICLATWTAKGGVGEEVLTILADRDMAPGHVGEAGAQCVSEPYEREPRATFSIGGFNSVLLFILKF